MATRKTTRRTKSSTTKAKASASRKGATARKQSTRKAKPPVMDQKRGISPPQLWLVGKLLAAVPASKMGGYAAPTTAAEASAQIRTMSGAPLDCTRDKARKFVDGVIGGSGGTAKPPISTEKELRAAAKKVRA